MQLTKATRVIALDIIFRINFLEELSMKKTGLLIATLTSLFLGGVGGYFLSDYSAVFIVRKQIVAIKETIIKPKVLFHGSPNRNITTFEPRAIGTRDPSEGPVVFATPHIGFAAAFLIRWNDSWVRQGSFDWGHYHFICSDKERFLKTDKGGAIYILPSDNFRSNLKKGMRSAEWTTDKPVEPLQKLEFDSCLEAMMSFGIQVFFVNKESLKKINNAKSTERLNIISGLESENKKRGFTVLPLTPLSE